MKFAIICAVLMGSANGLFRATREYHSATETPANGDFNFVGAWGPAGYVRFEVQTAGEAVFCLSSSQTCDAPSMSVQVSLGCVENKMIHVALASGDTQTFTLPNPVLNASEFVKFTVLWDQGFITIWKEGESKAVATIRDLQPLDVHNFGFKTKSKGSWRIIAPCKPAACVNATELCAKRTPKEYHTTSSPRYEYIPFNDGEVGSLRFEVKAAQEAFLILSNEEASAARHRQLEVNLGLSGNTKSILYFQAKPRREAITLQILDVNRYVGFWLLWTQGFVSLWVDGDSVALATRAVDDTLNIRYLGIQTYTNNGDWKIQTCDATSTLAATTTPRPPTPPEAPYTDDTATETPANGAFNFVGAWGPAGYMKFAVKTAGEAVFCLSSSQTCDAPSMSVQVSLGCVSNTMTHVALTSGGTKTFNSPGLLNASAFVNITVLWDEGFITIWKEGESKAVATIRDPQPLDVSFFGFKTKSNTGSWTISAPSQPAFCEKTAAVCHKRTTNEYHTTSNADYTYIPLNDGEVGSLRFEVKAGQNALLVLSRHKSSAAAFRQIEVTLGLSGNTKSSVHFQTPPRLEVITPKLLDVDRYVEFWLQWSQGYVSLWLDGEEEAVLTRAVDDTLKIRYLGILTSDNDGDWKIQRCETPSSIPATTVPPHITVKTWPPLSNERDCKNYYNECPYADCNKSDWRCNGDFNCIDHRDEEGCDFITTGRIWMHLHPVTSNRLNFKVRARLNAGIALYAQKHTDFWENPMNPNVHVYIKNSESYFFQHNSHYNRVKTPNNLDKDKFQGFWITWTDDGFMQVGKEGVETPFMEWQDPDPIAVVSFTAKGEMDYGNRTAQWIFQSP